MIFGVDNLEALDNRKVLARLRLNGRQIVVHGGGLLFHHHKLLKRAQAAPDHGLRQKPCSSSRIADAAPRAQTIRRPRLSTPL
jgi:hypothetical protein